MEKTITNEYRNVKDLGDQLIDHQSEEYDFYIGMDVHKATIAVATALPGRSPMLKTRQEPLIQTFAMSVGHFTCM